MAAMVNDEFIKLSFIWIISNYLSNLLVIKLLVKIEMNSHPNLSCFSRLKPVDPNVWQIKHGSDIPVLL